jgi:hypothetical protein
MSLRRFKINKAIETKEINTTWKIEQDGVVFILSTDKVSIGDYFVFTAPNDPNKILTGNETVKYNTINYAKVLWCYNKNEKDLDGILYKAKPSTG